MSSPSRLKVSHHHLPDAARRLKVEQPYFYQTGGWHLKGRVKVEKNFADFPAHHWHPTRGWDSFTTNASKRGSSDALRLDPSQRYRGNRRVEIVGCPGVRSIVMSSLRTECVWNRREVLAAGCALGGALALSRVLLADDSASKEQSGPYSPFKMGIQSYSLRGLGGGLQKALAATKDLGLHFWEAYPAHLPITVNSQAASFIKREISATGVTVCAYGVVPLGKDAAANQRTFEFAKAFGLEYLSADPDPGALDSIDKLIEKFGVAVGIHNHGPGHRYATIETLANTIKDHNPKLGVCIDTGHFLRSKEDPVHAVEAFGKRVYGVHLKDVKDAVKFTILGQGDLRTVDFLNALAKNNYSHLLAIEYEESPEHPVADIKACLAETAKAIAEVRKSGKTETEKGKEKEKGKEGTSP
jgi:sugar phosphate isomerase/epimerase